MKIKEIIGGYVERDKKWRAAKDSLDRKIEEREAQLQRLKKREVSHYGARESWVDSLVKPIAEEMLPYFPGRYFDFLGPFGLGARTSIHFYKEGVDEKDRFSGRNCLSITFEPGDLDAGELRLVDEHTNTGKYRKDTIGEVNGFNHPAVDMPDTIQGLVKFMNRQEAV